MSIKIKSLYSGLEWERYLNLQKAFKIPYHIRQSTYTLQIVSEALDIYFMQNVQSENAFKGFAMIKADIKNNGLSPPEIKKSDLQYFKFSPPDQLRYRKNTIYNIDIKSAYATALFNRQVITPRVFNYMARQKKPDRLAMVGMLASNPNFYFYDGAGELLRTENRLNPLANFFFQCVADIQYIMSLIAGELGDDFLFYWVDGIYFKTESARQKIETILQDHKYNFTFEVLTDFFVIENQKRFTLSFIKGDGKKKVFKIDKNDYSTNKRLIELLSLHRPENGIIFKQQ